MVRLKDIAAHAGVSVMTVSKALRGATDISDATKSRLRHLAQQMGYSPDYMAQGLRNRQTKLLGLVLSTVANPIFARTVAAIEEHAHELGYQLILTHTLNLPDEFVDGIRVTDKATLKIVGEELEKLNRQIVAEIKDLKGDVTGLRGQENIIFVKKKKAAKDLGFVGTITSVNKEDLEEHLSQGQITVVSPMGMTVEKQSHNVNADEVASAIANSMKAEKLVLLTDVPGVMRDLKDMSTLMSTLTLKQVDELIKSDVIVGGMIPKVNSCVEALKGGGVNKTHIVDARMPHALLLEFFTDQGVGTQIIKS